MSAYLTAVNSAPNERLNRGVRNKGRGSHAVDRIYKRASLCASPRAQVDQPSVGVQSYRGVGPSAENRRRHVVTAPITIPARTAPNTPAGSRLRPRLPAQPLIGRWPATDQLAAEIASPRLTAQTTAAGPGSIAPAPIERQEQAERIELIDAAVSEVQEQDEIAFQTGEAAEAQVNERPELSAAPQPTFIERMEVITEQFSNPSTGETSVDRPLVTVDEHEVDYEYESAPSQRQTPTGPRL